MSDARIPEGYPPRRTSTEPPTELIDEGSTERTTAFESSIVLMTGEDVLIVVPREFRTESLIEKDGMETGESTMNVQTVEALDVGSRNWLKIRASLSFERSGGTKKSAGMEPRGYCSYTTDI
jgi:hypothetical protein